MTSEARPAGFGALLWLALATFSMGIDGYVLAGLLPQIADDLDVSNAAAGQLVAIFALTAAVAGPVLSALTGAWERKAVIAGSLALFVIGNLVIALAPTYAIAMAGRIVSAVGGALLTAVVSAYVLAKSQPDRRGRALSFVVGGFLVATALGVPVGLVIGQLDWRLPLYLVAVVGTIALIGILINVPKLHLPALSLRETLRPLKQPVLIGAILVATGIMCASYLCFTYATLIFGPRVDGAAAIIAAMFGYGLVSLIGNIISGRANDRFAPVSVITLIIGVLIAVALLGTAGLMLPGFGGAVAAFAWFFACALFNGGSGVALQSRLGDLAPGSMALVLALNASGMQLGSALGGILGGALLVAGLPADGLVPASAVVLVVTLVLHLGISRAARRRGRTPALAA
ncbi:MFS transporter, DHA1 family [Microbacterium esteraromaticum]|uniref:MFS transporter, DHA1 family n=1 Tax=Microbacterium esteraromaticum TaxID=57043 RepID=A0A1R4KML9_9MICO|nr:MFS transporter [Microbacterium esteraromaticum]SJN45293.1 MFS transporter, DHA1 family [Microbacterium esteraromaticum]